MYRRQGHLQNRLLSNLVSAALLSLKDIAGSISDRTRSRHATNCLLTRFYAIPPQLTDLEVFSERNKNIRQLYHEGQRNSEPSRQFNLSAQLSDCQATKLLRYRLSFDERLYQSA